MPYSRSSNRRDWLICKKTCLAMVQDEKIQDSVRLAAIRTFIENFWEKPAEVLAVVEPSPTPAAKMFSIGG